MRRIAAVAVMLAAACALTAPVYAQDVIKIAAGAPLTGPLAKQGQEVANAVKLAVEEWNAKAREAGIGVKRKATLVDIRLALKAKRLISEGMTGWFARSSPS